MRERKKFKMMRRFVILDERIQRILFRKTKTIGEAVIEW